ncbi:MAG TPA: hypothetical protein VK302_14325 [Terriglobales bacterium]|nr:hypothetical protein [Terriglobales bacterium]
MPINNGFACVRKKANAIVKAVTRLVGKSQKPTGSNAEQWIEEFERLSGSGHSDGWHFDRDEIHQRR